MNFNFNDSPSHSQAVQPLAPNAIHTVVFDGCEARDFTGPTGEHHVIEIKFHDPESKAAYSHTIWQPKEDDWKETQSQYGPNPSNVVSMVYLCKHLIDAVNPEAAEKINNGTLSFDIDETRPESSWKSLRSFMVENTQAGIGKTTKIKLLANSKGEGKFPAYFMSYSKEGKLYMKTNFIGSNVFFTTKELTAIKNASKAAPTPISSTIPGNIELPKQTPSVNKDFDLNI